MPKRYMTAFALASLLMAPPSQAGDLRLALSVSVPTVCVVNGVRAVDVPAGIIRVDASCNSSAFQLVLGGDLANLPIHSASADRAAVTVRRNTLSVRPERPGQLTFDIHYAADLGAVRSAIAEIEAS
jgi:hypothetical protein